MGQLLRSAVKADTSLLGPFLVFASQMAHGAVNNPFAPVRMSLLLSIRVHSNCVAIDVLCPALGTPIYGNKSTTQRYRGIVVTFTCSKGYQLWGSSSTTCTCNNCTLGTLGLWNNSVPRCVGRRDILLDNDD